MYILIETPRANLKDFVKAVAFRDTCTLSYWKANHRNVGC